MTESLTLYRPTGLRELELIWELGGSKWPPRLPEQPIFYPVMNREYAEQIARQWNRDDEFSGYVGFVTRFAVDGEFAQKYPVKVVGQDDLHREMWVPAEELEDFNRHILGRIQLIDAFYGEKYSQSLAAGKRADQWWEEWQGADEVGREKLLEDSGVAFLANYRWWRDEKGEGEVDSLRRLWTTVYPHLGL